MGRKMKVVLAVSLGLILAAGLAVWLLISNLDGIVKHIVEDIGTETVGTEVSLDDAKVELPDASATLRGLTVENPGGFDSPYALEFGSIGMSINPSSINGDELVLPLVTVSQAQISFEQKASGNNLQLLLGNVEESTSETDSSASESESPRLVIEEFRLTGTRMTVTAPELGETISFVMPDIILRDIGRSGNGVTAQEATQQILEPILNEAMATAKNRARKEIEEQARQEFEKQADKAVDSVRKKLFGN